MTEKEIVEEYIDSHEEQYVTWLAEHIGYAGGMDWDSYETRLTFVLEEGVKL